LFSGRSSGRPISPSYTGFCKRWSWYKVVADLAEDKILLFDQILAKPVVEIFGFLLYKIDKISAEEEQERFNKSAR